MARIRTIKPEFFTSEDVVALSPFARLLYVALWCESDKEGRMVWKPRTFKMRYFPADDLDIDALCKELTDAHLVALYGEGYAWIPTFKAHQHINPRESLSQLPEPDASTTRKPRVGTRQSRDSDAQGGREGKGREVNTSGFESFWEAWPKGERKQGKSKCQSAWLRKNLEARSAEILAHVASMKETKGWREGYEPMPITYLNQERWDGAESGNTEEIL